MPIEWLAEIIYALAYRLAGYSGVAALVTAALIALHAIVFFNASRWTRPLLAIVLMDLGLIPTMLARPHLLGWPLLARMDLDHAARSRGTRSRTAVGQPRCMMTLWANLHGSFVFGLADRRRRSVSGGVASSDQIACAEDWGLIFGSACVVAVFVNGGWPRRRDSPGFASPDLQMLPLIDEWKPSNPRRRQSSSAMLAVVLGLGIWRPAEVALRCAGAARCNAFGLALFQMYASPGDARRSSPQ